MFSRKAVRRLAMCAVALVFVAGLSVAPLSSSGSTTIAQLQNQYNTLEKEQKQIQQQLKQNANDQQDTQATQAALSRSISIVQQQVTLLTQKITALNTQITQKQQQIDQKQLEIEQKQASIEMNIELFKERLRAMYISGDMSFLQVLCSSTNIIDFLNKEEILRYISVHDTTFVDKLKQQQQDITNDKAELVNEKSDLGNQKSDLVSSNNDLKQKRSDLNQAIAAQNQLLSNQKAQAAALAARGAEVKKEMDAANKQIEALQSQGQYVGGAMLWPLQGIRTTLTSTFTWRTSPNYGYREFHEGIDITKAGGGTYGYPIRAVNAGTINLAMHSNVSYGNHIVIDHGGGMMSLYGHCSSFAPGIAVGVHVTKGQIIAYVGSTGNSTGPHLHLSILLNGKYVNPLNYTYSNENCNNSGYYRTVNPYYKVDPS